MKKIIIAAVLCAVLIGGGFYGWWGGIIADISVSGMSIFEDSLQSTVIDCVSHVKGKSMWSSSTTSLIKSIKDCDVMIKDVSYTNEFPRKAVVEVTYYQPVAKLPLADHCELLVSPAVISLPLDRCVSYTVPVIKGVSTFQGNPLTQFVDILASQLKYHAITASELEYRGDLINAWIVVKLQEKKEAYIPVSSEISKKVSLLKASIVGLEEAHERYTSIDLRFDRVVYK